MKKLILLLAMGAALTTQTLFAQVPSYVPTDGLVGYWPFNGNANDLSLNSNNGTASNIIWGADRFGNSSSTAEFNGDDTRSIIINNPIGSSSNKKTFSAWIKLPVIYGANLYYNHIITASDNSTQLYYSVLGNYSSYITNDWTNKLGCQGSIPVSNQMLNTNNWHHALVVFDGDSSMFYQYIDGVYQGSSGFANTPNFNNWTKIIFGQNDGNLSQCIFAGQIDDIGIWDRALTQEEITNLYNSNQCFNNITVTDTLIINVGQLSYNNPITYANNITIAPNPASSQININFNNITDLNGGTLKVINSLGQEVATTPITTSGTNSTMQLATWGGTGMYFVQIINPLGQIIDIKKIILQ